MTNYENTAAVKHENRINRLVSLRTSLVKAQTELSALSSRSVPTDPRTLVEIEIAIAELERQESKLTQQYREELLAHVQASEDEQ